MPTTPVELQPQPRPLLRQIVARASMPFERLEEPFRPAAGPEDEPLIRSRLDEWARSLSADGTEETLQRFLAWQGLDMAAARQAVGPVQLPEDAPLPAWAELLGEALALGPAGFQDRAGLLDPDKPLPFEELSLPFVHVFQQRLEAQVSAQDLLAAEAYAVLSRWLLARLADAAAAVFYAEFQVARTTGMGPLARLLPPGSDALYQGFIRRMREGELVALFARYPVLARRLAVVTFLWTEAHVEFLQRLAADRPEIARVFGAEGDLGNVEEIEPALSDPHWGGRGVISVAFEGGLRLVYKPKSLGVEAAYNQLLTWLSEHGAPLDLKALRVLNRGTHGWVEFAGHAPCADAAAVARYYRRAGMLMCLVYALEGTDCHGENLVASGEYPVLIDNETLMHHRVRPGDLGDLHDSAQFQAYEQLEHSVLRTGLLPGWLVGKDESVAFDISGLGGYADQALPYRRSRWTHVNSDRMTLTFEPGTLPPQPNIPHLNDTPARLDEHVDAIAEGLVAMYRFLLARREEILASDGPLEAFKGQTVRFVFRATRVYGLILKQLSQPRYLRDGADYGLVLELLARAYLLGEEKPFYWSILHAERRAMQQWDVPAFAARVDDDSLILGLDGSSAGEVANYFTGPSFDLAVERLRSLSETDLDQQLQLTQAALHARVADEWRKVPEAYEEPTQPDVPLLDRAGFVARAVALAEGLNARAIRGMDGSATWIAPIYMSQAERFQLGHLNLDLYDGLAGVALFLAALEFVGADPERDYRELCLATLQAVRRELGEAAVRRRIPRWLGIGGATGLGSVLYALVRVSRFLDEPALLAEAVTAARLLTPEDIAEDRALDVIGGAAGAILGLLAVYEASQDAVVLERAMDCARHLLEARVAGEAGSRAWSTIGGKLLTGFSHGAAGIAYALLRLAGHAVVDEFDLGAVAAEAIAYEDSVFVESVGNWPDLRPSRGDVGLAGDGPQIALAWCHGAPGIGLARLGGLPALDTPAIRRDVEVALATTQRALAYQQHDADHICCGNMGRVEVLLVAGERLGRPALVEEARRQASQVVARAERGTGYRFSTMLPRGVHSPSLFQGAAGIGYELLRLAYPYRLPSVLLWE